MQSKLDKNTFSQEEKISLNTEVSTDIVPRSVRTFTKFMFINATLMIDKCPFFIIFYIHQLR